MAGAPFGNQNAAKAKKWTAAIERALERRKGVGLAAMQAALDELADKFIVAVENGDISAWREFGDRLEGKPAQVIAGDPDAPLQTITEIQIRSVDPA